MNWKYQVAEFNQIMLRDDLALDEAKRGIIPILEKNHAFNGLNLSVIEGIKGAESDEQFNEFLDMVYDFADNKRIWLGI